MEIYRISCVVIFVMMLISGILLILFPRARHKENFYMQMLNNLNVGFFSGLMVSYSMALLGYFYVKEEFVNNLLEQSAYIYTNLTDMHNHLTIVSSDKDFFARLPVLLGHLQSRTYVIEEDAKKVNFLQFSPFFKDSHSALQIYELKKLFYEFKKYPDFFTRMNFLENERNLAIADNDKSAITTADEDIKDFISDLITSVNKDLVILSNFLKALSLEYSYKETFWESFKTIPIIKEKTDDKKIKKD